MPSTLLEDYRQAVEQGQLAADSLQEHVLHAFSKLLDDVQSVFDNPSRWQRLRKPMPPKGIYLYGPVGRGKSMLMDMFYSHVKVAAKRRIHFHAFMLDVHARIHALRQTGRSQSPVREVAEQMAREVNLLCLDELQVHDVADAMILSQFFTTLFDKGVVVVATSNRAPTALYQHGLQRERFLRFVALIEERMNVLTLEGPHDYRLSQIKSLEQTYVYPLGPRADDFIQRLLARLHAPQPLETHQFTIQGRILTVRTLDAKTAICRFEELCERPLGAQDYLAVAAEFEVIILTDIPQLGPEKRNEAKRFVTLVDALYEHRVKLIATADAKPGDLYAAGDGTFEFQRTASRLFEMQSAAYLASSHSAPLALM